jgi:hypothetical protein
MVLHLLLSLDFGTESITMEIDNYDTLWEDYYLKYRIVASSLRKPILFKWLYNNYTTLYLSCVDPSDVLRLADLKTCLALVDVAVDDACDCASLIENNGGDEFSYEMLNMLYNIDKVASGVYTPMYSNMSNNLYIKTSYYIFSDIIRNQVTSLPKYYNFRGEFFLAIRNVAESMEFSYILNKNKVIYPFSQVIKNKAASTMVAVHSILDLMCSNDFDDSELGNAISLFKMADFVAMLDNAIFTWKREIIERDYSSPIISLALEKKLIKFNDFEIISVEKLEECLLPLLEILNDELNNTLLSMEVFVENYEIKSFNASEFINNYRTYAAENQRKYKQVNNIVGL